MMFANFRDALLLESMFAQWLAGVSAAGPRCYDYNFYCADARQTFVNKLRRLTND